MSLDTLRAAYPWPDQPPDVPPDPHGWCSGDHRFALREKIGPTTRAIVELGAWLGASTRMMLGLAPAATVISVDHWKGEPFMNGLRETQQRLEAAHETFLVNQWQHRDRVIPIRSDTLGGLHEVHSHGVAPDLIYFDSEHTVECLSAELALARRLFPEAIFHGDDWRMPDVQTAVRIFADQHGYKIRDRGNAWTLA